MFRLFKDHITDNTLTLTPEEYQHLVKVNRLRPGQPIELVCKDNLISAEVKAVDKNTLSIIKIKKSPITPKTTPTITLLQCLPKQDKFADIIRMCSEIGLDEIIPIENERSIPKVKDVSANKLKRWENVALSAAMQSKRHAPVKLSAPISLKGFLEGLVKEDTTLCLLPWEEVEGQNLKTVLTKEKGPHKKIIIMIGPEGGLSAAEVAMLEAKGFIALTLGDTILRTEHAGFYVLSQLNYFFD